MSSEFEDRLRNSLSEQEASLEIAGAGPAAVASRGAARTENAGIMRVAAALVVGAGLGAMAYAQFSNDSDQLIDLAQEDTTTTTVDNASRTGDASADFGMTTVEGGLAWFGNFLTDDGQLIQITTKPGQTWEDSDAATGQDFVVQVSDRTGLLETHDLPAGIAPTSASFYGGVLFVVSTTPGTYRDGGGDVVVAQTQDNGASWNQTIIDLGDAPDNPAQGVYRYSSIAANGAGVVVAVQSSYFTDYQYLLPQYTWTEGSNYEIRENSDGVEVRDWTENNRISEEQSRQCDPYSGREFGDGETGPALSEEDWMAIDECYENLPPLPEPEVVATFTWADLGFSGPPPREEFSLYFSSDGTEFAEAEPPLVNGSGNLVSSDAAFVLTMWESVRFGDEFEEAESSYEGEYIDTSKLFRSVDGTTWAQTEKAPGGCGIGPSTGGLLVSYSCKENGEVHFSADGAESWIKTAAVPADGRADYSSYSNVYAGKLGFVAFRTTERRYEIYEDEIRQLEEEANAEDNWEILEQKYAELADRSFAIFFSSDGQTWTQIELPDDLKGQELWGYDAVVGANDIVVTLGGNSTEGPRTLFLTPR